MNTPVNDPQHADAADAQQPGALAARGAAAVVTHYNVQPVIDVYASTQDRDLGGVARDVNKSAEDVPAAAAARHAH